ncbi:MAG: iron dicitrate transport regulator FecR [Planctomycetota bacterium]
MSSMPKPNRTADQLIHRYLLGVADQDEVMQLEQALDGSAELQRDFIRAAQIDACAHGYAVESSIAADSETSPQLNLSSDGTHADRIPSVHKPSRALASVFRFAFITATAASIALVAVWVSRTPRSIARIVSSENAAWESVLPTRPGENLTPGALHLKSGVATIQFECGAELVLEAPADLQLISAMRCRLNFGAAVVNVPESGRGFIVESPDGYAVDYGTKFAVEVDDVGRHAGYELIEGEIEVHHSQSGRSMRLTDAGSSVILSGEVLRRVEEQSIDAFSDVSSTDRWPLSVGTEGRCGTAMPRFHKRSKFIDPNVLSVKRSDSGKWDYRSFFSFDVSKVDFEKVSDVRLRLNLVPSPRGLVSRLPQVNRFGVYGLTNPAKADWKIESTWDESPGPEDGTLLGAFEIERSQTRGIFGIEGKALLDFVRSHRHTPITLILVRETTQIKGDGPGMTHTFASDQHPESVGPLLEFSIAD